MTEITDPLDPEIPVIAEIGPITPRVWQCNDERAETRSVNKLVDSLTTFHRFSAPRTLSLLQEHLIK